MLDRLIDVAEKETDAILTRDAYRVIVCALLSELAEPTEVMVDAARHDWHNNHGPNSAILHGEMIDGIWRSMLSAITKEE